MAFCRRHDKVMQLNALLIEMNLNKNPNKTHVERITPPLDDFHAGQDVKFGRTLHFHGKLKLQVCPHVDTPRSKVKCPTQLVMQFHCRT